MIAIGPGDRGCDDDLCMPFGHDEMLVWLACLGIVVWALVQIYGDRNARAWAVGGVAAAAFSYWATATPGSEFGVEDWLMVLPTAVMLAVAYYTLRN